MGITAGTPTLASTASSSGYGLDPLYKQSIMDAYGMPGSAGKQVASIYAQDPQMFNYAAKMDPEVGGMVNSLLANDPKYFDGASVINPTEPVQVGAKQQTLGNFAMDPKYTNALVEGLNTQNDLAKLQKQRLEDWDNSFMGQASPYVQGFANISQGFGSLAGIFTGFKSLGMMEDQLDIAKEQWEETKTELARVKQVRDKLNTSYMA